MFSVPLGLSYKVCVIVIANHNVICVAQKWTLNQSVCENLALIYMDEEDEDDDNTIINIMMMI